ncbi:hypothetical protein ACFC4G_39485 [Streptomyces sp. NPDC056002]|uniref:hypothetical protein n=1 Tax=Streptomyces sp. NPDC056002 TaxID=3345675 RepID=UPI0035D68371
MTVYFTFIPSRRKKPADLTAMEFAPNQEVPERAIKRRVSHHHGPTYYDGVKYGTPLADSPVADFPDADPSAYLLVWRRSATQVAPKRGEAPDEVWTLTPRGRVVKNSADATR